jgi:hypothetical protein
LRILCTSFPRMLAWYVFPLVAVAVWYDWNNPNALTNLGALEIGRMTLALAVGAGCSMIAHFFVWWLRRSLWERYLENLPIFSASVLPPSPLVGDMKGGTGTVIAIGLGEPLFQR